MSELRDTAYWVGVYKNGGKFPGSAEALGEKTTDPNPEIVIPADYQEETLRALGGTPLEKPGE